MIISKLNGEKLNLKSSSNIKGKMVINDIFFLLLFSLVFILPIFYVANFNEMLSMYGNYSFFFIGIILIFLLKLFYDLLSLDRKEIKTIVVDDVNGNIYINGQLYDKKGISLISSQDTDFSRSLVRNNFVRIKLKTNTTFYQVLLSLDDFVILKNFLNI